MNKPTEVQLSALRGRVAKLCGWEYDPVQTSDAYYRPLVNHQTKQRVALDGLPDYCNDLNAMHEAERLLETVAEEIRLVFWLELLKACGPRPAEQGYWSLLHATAWQRAVALDRTLSKTPIL